MAKKPTYAELERRVRELERAEVERENTDNALRNQKRFMDNVIDSLWDTVYIFDQKDGKGIRWNKALEEISGYDNQKMRHLPPTHFYPEEEHAIIDNVFRDIKKHGFAKAELTYLVSDGRGIPFEYSVVPVTGPDGQEWMCAIGRDITERKTVESVLLNEKLLSEKYINSLPGLFYVFDENRFVKWNAEWNRITGYSDDELAGMYGTDFFEGKYRKLIEKRMRKVFSDGSSEAEAELITKDGRRISYFFTGLRIELNGKEHLIGLGIDITERKQMELRLQQAQKIEAIGTLAGGIAHDFNNLLGIITGNISYSLTRIDENDGVFEALTEAQEGVSQAQNLTHQLITFAKGGSPIKKVINLRGILEDSARFATRGTKTRYDFRFAEKLFLVEADPGQMNQVFTNLIINATQAMPDGGTIEINTENIAGDSDGEIDLGPGRHVKITITDQGIGIPAKQIQNIFDPYFSTKHKGKGLGLATTHSIIKKHNGQIIAKSLINNGTSFSIYLPAKTETTEKPQEEKKTQHVPHRGRGRVLVMDDHEQVLKTVARMLHGIGYESELASDGNEAIAKYREAHESQKPYDVVILDLTVPGALGGAKTIPELLKIDSNARVLVSSGYSNDPIMSNYEDYGFCGVLSKPFTIRQLETTFNSLFG